MCVRWLKRTARGLTLAALLPLVGLGACGDGGAEVETVVVGMRSDFGALNPVTTTSSYTRQVLRYALLTPLIRYDEELEVRPYLAEDWEMVGDTAVIFYLRDDVYWHDGVPVTAEDVKFTFELAKNPETASLLGSVFLSQVESAEVLDTYTIRFDFVRPHAQALEDFWWAPLPKHLLADVPPAELRNAEYNRHPVGSGPFRFVEWQPNTRLVLAANPEFPEELGGPPEADRIVFQIVPEPATLLTATITGGVDVDIPLQPNQAVKVENSEDLELVAYPGRTFMYIGWNTRRELFDEAIIRRAMTLAINRQEIIEALLFGYGTIASSPFPPWHRLSPDIEPLPYAPERAAALLAEAGWVDRDGDGVRENPEGEPLRFTLLTSNDPLNSAVAEVVQEQLGDIGVQVEVRVLEFQTLLARHKSRDFDAVLSRWVLDNFRLAPAAVALFHSRVEGRPAFGAANRSSYANPEADELIEEGAAATDPEEAVEVWREFAEVLQQDQPFTFMMWLDELAAYRTELEGVDMDPRGELHSIAEWSVVEG